MAVLALVVVQALAKSPWGVFTIATTIPVALIMGLGLRSGRISVAGLRLSVSSGLALRRLGRAIPFAYSGAAKLVSARREMARLGANGLRPCGFDLAGVAAAHAARLSEHFPETGNRRGHGGRRRFSSGRRCSCRRLRGSSTARGRSSPGRYFRSSASRSRAARSPGSIRSSPPARRRRWSRANRASATSATERWWWR